MHAIVTLGVNDFGSVHHFTNWEQPQVFIASGKSLVRFNITSLVGHNEYTLGNACWVDFHEKYSLLLKCKMKIHVQADQISPTLLKAWTQTVSNCIDIIKLAWIAKFERFGFSFLVYIKWPKTCKPVTHCTPLDLIGSFGYWFHSNPFYAKVFFWDLQEALKQFENKTQAIRSVF